MFTIAVWLLFSGYAAIYTGIANLLNGMSGPTFMEALGVTAVVAPPGADHPNDRPLVKSPNVQLG